MIRIIRSKSDTGNYTTKIRFFSVFDIGFYTTDNLGKHKGMLFGIGNKQLHITYRDWNTGIEGVVSDA